MPRLDLKPDSSYFRKIALGAVGGRHVARDPERLGHRIVELERGVMETKLWKHVKRKRVRIPDLVCELCGLRVESRAKTKTELSMSHSLSAHERAWDFGGRPKRNSTSDGKRKAVPEEARMLVGQSVLDHSYRDRHQGNGDHDHLQDFGGAPVHKPVVTQAFAVQSVRANRVRPALDH